MVFLGVDQSLNATGICVLSDEGTVITLVTVAHKVGGPIDVKLLNIRRSVISALSGARFAAMEGYSYDSIHRAFDLGAVAGTVMTAFVEHAIPYVVTPPATLKLFGAGIATATKTEMISAAKTHGATPTDDNQADAFFLARVARAMTLGCERKRHEMEATHSLRLMASGKQNKPASRKTRRIVKNAL